MAHARMATSPHPPPAAAIGSASASAPDARAAKAEEMVWDIFNKNSQAYTDGAPDENLHCADEIDTQMRDKKSRLYMHLLANFDADGNPKKSADKLWDTFMLMARRIVKARNETAAAAQGG